MRSAWAITYCRGWRKRLAALMTCNAVFSKFGVLTGHRDSKAVHMSMVSISLTLAIRVVLVFLFLPFSALDKVLDFRSAVAQAQEAVPNKAAGTALILVGLLWESRIVPAHSCLLATVR